MLQKDEAQGFLDFCEPEFFRVFCMESDMWTCALVDCRSSARRQWMPMGRPRAPICN